MQRLTVGAVVGRFGGGGVRAGLGAMESVAHLDGSVCGSQSSRVGDQPSVDVLRIDGEVQEKVLDLHHVTHRIHRNREISGQRVFERSLEVGNAAVDEEAQPT